MALRQPLRWIASVTSVLLLAMLVTSCVWQSDDRQAANLPGFLLSYSGAADRLAGMGGPETAEQLRDWARTGLAADLQLDTARLIDTAYDTLPVRDEGFADLARQPIGPGRSLFADGVLHLLVPKDDQRRHRTIGLLLDQHRTDAGSDPPRVQLHPYTVRSEIQSIHVESDDPVATDDLRRAHGYVRGRIDSSQDLTDFLYSTRALSTIEVVGSEVWAGGWKWPEVDGQRLTREDVAVLQRGYDSSTTGTTPGFSLDPGPMETAADLTAVIPGISDELLDGIVHDTWNGPYFGSADELTTAVEAALFGELTEAEMATLELPADRTHLWALRSYLLGDSPYGQARYDGDLRGTEVGMTLFYTDYLTKDWVNGVGTGVPTEAVAGFEPDTTVATPWSHCDTADDSSSESGRLWFGQNEAAYSFQHDRISIGAQPVRLFAKSDGEAGAEVESSYSFGRGLRWLDQHYQAVADYEPQFHRLDQIMRWSAALEWLSANRTKLPPHSEANIRDDLRFADWYRSNSDTLRERAPIPFVTPPAAAQQESVLTVPSERFESCGLTVIHGGVSLGDLGARKAKADRTFQADLPGPVRRAGLYDEKSVFDSATGTGSVKQVSIDDVGAESSFRSHTISRQDNGTARVEIAASPRRVTLMGALKVWRDATAPRAATVELRGSDGQVSQQVRYQGQDLGGLTAVRQGELITLRWRSGIVDRVTNVMEALQNRLASGRGGTPVDGVLYSMQDSSGRVLHRVGGEGEPWLSITSDATAGTDLAFRLGVPGPDGPQFSFATLVADPALPAGRWMKVTPATTDTAATAAMVEAPANGAPTVQVIARDGRTGTLYPDGDSARVAVDDPVLGRDGTPEGAALLRDYPRVATALKEAVDAGDDMLRGVLLGSDGAALVRADGVRLVGTDDHWSHVVARATTPNQTRLPRFASYGDHLLYAAEIPLRTVPGTRKQRELGDVLDEHATVLIHESLRTTLSLADGPVVVDALPRNTEVTVAEVRVTREEVRVDTAAQPDIWEHGGARWWRVVGSPVTTDTDTDTGDDEPTASITPSTFVPAPPASALILLVCSEDDDDACAA